MLDDDLNLTPPIRSESLTHWEKQRHTPNRTDALSKSPMTPPLRPNSNMSIYSDTGENLFNKTLFRSMEIFIYKRCYYLA